MKTAKDFGALPDGWALRKFGEIVADVTAGNMKIKKGDYLEAGDLPVVDQGSQLIGGYVNDLEVACSASLPTIIFGDHTRLFKFIDFPFALGADGVKVLEPIDRADRRYLFHYLRQVQLPNDLGYSRHFKYLKKCLIPLPPLAEQKRIAAILDKADAIRRKRAQALRLADDFLKSAFLDLFGDPVTNPKGWDKVSVVETGSLVQIGPFGSLLHKSDYITGGIPLINPKHIVGGEIIVGDQESVSPEKADELSTYWLQPGDVLMGRRGEMGRCAVVRPDNGQLLCGTGSLFIRPNTAALLPLFVFMAMSSQAMKTYLENAAQGVTMANLNASMIKDLNLPVPPIDLQRKFAEITSLSNVLRTKMQGATARNTQLFDSLVQRAFKGEL